MKYFAPICLLFIFPIMAETSVLPNSYFLTSGVHLSLGVSGFGLNMGSTYSRRNMFGSVRYLQCLSREEHDGVAIDLGEMSAVFGVHATRGQFVGAGVGYAKGTYVDFTEEEERIGMITSTFTTNHYAEMNNIGAVVEYQYFGMPWGYANWGILLHVNINVEKPIFYASLTLSGGKWN